MATFAYLTGVQYQPAHPRAAILVNLDLVREVRDTGPLRILSFGPQPTDEISVVESMDDIAALLVVRNPEAAQ